MKTAKKKEGVNHGYILLKLRNNKQINMLTKKDLKKKIKFKAPANEINWLNAWILQCILKLLIIIILLQ